jgi:hypothetical protein
MKTNIHSRPCLLFTLSGFLETPRLMDARTGRK